MGKINREQKTLTKVFVINEFDIRKDNEGFSYNLMICSKYTGEPFLVKVEGTREDIDFLYRIRQSLIGRRALVKYTAQSAEGIPMYATLVEIVDI